MKQTLHIIASVLLAIILMAGIGLVVLANNKVETTIMNFVAGRFAHTLGTEARVGAVEYSFPARLTLRDIYIEDLQKDTLLYLNEVYAHLRPIPLLKKEIRISHVRVAKGVAKIHDRNYQFLIDAFKSNEEKDEEPLQNIISVRDIQLNDLRVEYEDYHIVLSKANADLNHLTEEELDAQISELVAAVTKSNIPKTDRNFRIDDFQARLILNDTLLNVPTLKAKLPRSRLDLGGIQVHFPPGDTLYLSESADKIQFSLDFHEAVLVPADIALFVPQIKGIRKPFALHGALRGKLDSLYFNNIAVQYDGKKLLEGNVAAVGLPDFSNPYLRANLRGLHVNAALIQDFLSQLYNKPVLLGSAAHQLGDIHYRGTIQGRLRDITLHGAFTTALGAISTDGTLRSDSAFQHMDYNASVVARQFNFGRLTAHEPLSTATVDISSTGQVNKGKLRGDIDASISQFTYNDYTYQDLQINGQFEPNRFAGEFDINDPHLSLAFDGIFDWQDQNPEMNFNLLCRHFDTTPLGLDNITNHLRTRFNLAMDMNAAEKDNITGYLVLDSLFVATQQDSILMKQLTLLTSAMPDRSKMITLQSDFFNAQADGIFSYQDILPALQAMVHHYLPSAVNNPTQDWKPVSLALRVNGQRLRGLQRLFTAPVTLSDHPSLRAEMQLEQQEEPHVELHFFAPGIRAGNTPVHDLTMTLNTISSLRHAGAKGSGLALSIAAEAMNTQSVFSSLAFKDTLLSQLTMRRESQAISELPEGWKELSPRELQNALSDNLSVRERQHALLAAQRDGDYGGDVKMVTYISKYKNRPLVDFHLMPGTILLRDSVYTIGDSHITYCAADTTIAIDDFTFEGVDQHIYANGLVSSHKSDTLQIDLLRIDAAYMVPFFLPVQTIMFNGLLSGRATAAGVLKQPQLDTQIHIDSMGLNNCYFGDADVDLHIYPQRMKKEGDVLPPQLQFHADVYRPYREVVDLDGEALFDGSGKWELDMTADSVPLAFVNHWTSTVLDNLDGNATGRVIVGGKKGMTYVLLRAEAQNASFTLPWTGARYTIPHDTIIMDTTAILFPNVHLVDKEGNNVEVNGGVYHDQFRDFGLDIHVDVHNAIAFHSEKEGEMLQGKVYADGHVDVTGNEDDILVNADAVTTGKSRFRLSLDNASSANASNFVHFVEHPDIVHIDSTGESDLDNIDFAEVAKVDTSLWHREGRCILTLNLDVNPRLLFQLVLGERNGDMIQARGSGALRLTYDTQTGDVRLLGTYDIERGTLSYTVANVIRKEFIIGEGATISFSGDATNPLLDVTAKYRVTASLKDLFGDEIDQLSTSRTSIPVLTCLHLTGPLSNPILSFSLEFPMSDQAIQQQVRQVINTDEMMMRQVIYLLVFGRFFTPDYMSQAQYATLNSTYSLLSSTITGQINSWLSKLTDMVTLGVAIRTEGEGAGASQEYEAQFQIQPVDRLIINGNVGYRYNDISNQPFFGDLDVEFLLTEDGQWRLKGYTHTVDKYSLREASTIQGFGFLWKKDFNWPANKKKKKNKSPQNNNETETYNH